MKKIFIFLILFLSIVISPLFGPRAEAAMNPKVKVMLNMAGYGAAGGALLGLATIAFGADKMAIAQGASLGLYAGIIFGSYVVLSHPGGGRGRSYEEDEGGSYQEAPEEEEPIEDAHLRLKLQERPHWQMETFKRYEQFGMLAADARSVHINIVTVSF